MVSVRYFRVCRNDVYETSKCLQSKHPNYFNQPELAISIISKTVETVTVNSSALLEIANVNNSDAKEASLNKVSGDGTNN